MMRGCNCEVMTPSEAGSNLSVYQLDGELNTTSVFNGGT